MSKHTPGPWEAVPVPPSGQFSCEILGPTCRYDGAREVIAQVPGKFAPNCANADLIAAAPDLLEACKAALYVCRDAMQAGCDRKGALEADALIRAAIAKAEGK